MSRRRSRRIAADGRPVDPRRCAQCVTGGLRCIGAAADGRPEFGCSKCGRRFTYGRTGGPYAVLIYSTRGSGLYGRLTGDELLGASSLRGKVHVAMVESHDGEEGAQWALAERMAPMWRMTVKSANERLSRWFSGRRDMTTEPLEQLLGVLGLRIEKENGDE